MRSGQASWIRHSVMAPWLSHIHLQIARLLSSLLVTESTYPSLSSAAPCSLLLPPVYFRLVFQVLTQICSCHSLYPSVCGSYMSLCWASIPRWIESPLYCLMKQFLSLSSNQAALSGRNWRRTKWERRRAVPSLQRKLVSFHCSLVVKQSYWCFLPRQISSWI